MKVLFAVSNENISAQIVKKYQREYKEIISYKNMYYFNAVVKELQRDKSYDRIVIGEDLEPFSNNNYDAIDKFIFEKLDSISDEATGSDGDIPIILICADRRTKSEPMLVKLFGLGIYNALLGQDRSIDNVCKMINRPRSKKEAKIYYKIESEEVNYQSENENNVSELEIKNILEHYRRLGKNEDRYVESFNNIAAQYNDAQLRIITKFLPLNVKAVLEEQSPKYQSIMTFGDASSTINAINEQKKKTEGLKIGFLENGAGRPTRPVIVPTAVSKTAKKLTSNNSQNIRPEVKQPKENITRPAVNPMNKSYSNNNVQRQPMPEPELISNDNFDFSQLDNLNIPSVDEEEKIEVAQPVEPVKRGRGRPRKNPVPTVQEVTDKPKRGRGRPRKNPIQEPEQVLPGFDDVQDNSGTLPGFDDVQDNNATLPGFDDVQDNSTTLPGFDDIQDNDATLPGFDDIPNNNSTLQEFDNVQDNSATLSGYNRVQNSNSNTSGFNNMQSNNSQATWQNQQTTSNVTNYSGDNYYSHDVSKVTNLLSKDKKIVSFVGTTKNGTSFLVNNLGKTLASMGIKTAILDLTTNRNSYYIFTNNDEKLRGIAYESIKKLRSGIASGISADKNLDVYTALPGDTVPLEDVDNILSTLIQNYSLVLMDCDFNTPSEYFGATQELYVVQSLDILTIQPMTAFLRDLKAKDLLREEKIRVVINKEVRVRGLTPKAIIGGLAFYNDPSMSFMTELFNKDTVKYCTIPFDEVTYSKYLENVMDCAISTNGYSREFNIKIKELANMVYPLIGNKYKPAGDYSYNNSTFSSNMNNTLEQMKRKY